MRITKAQLEAKIEALLARIDALVAESDALRNELAESREETRCAIAQYRELAKTQSLVEDRASLIVRCRQLSMSGVPCVMQGDFVKHRITGAVLAQVKR